MKNYVIYAWSNSTMIVGERSNMEIDGAYVIINECFTAKDKQEALEVIAEERNIDINDLIAVEIN